MKKILLLFMGISLLGSFCYKQKGVKASSGLDDSMETIESIMGQTITGRNINLISNNVKGVSSSIYYQRNIVTILSNASKEYNLKTNVNYLENDFVKKVGEKKRSCALITGLLLSKFNYLKTDNQFLNGQYYEKGNDLIESFYSYMKTDNYLPVIKAGGTTPGNFRKGFESTIEGLNGDNQYADYDVSYNQIIPDKAITTSYNASTDDINSIISCMNNNVPVVMVVGGMDKSYVDVSVSQMQRLIPKISENRPVTTNSEFAFTIPADYYYGLANIHFIFITGVMDVAFVVKKTNRDYTYKAVEHKYFFKYVDAAGNERMMVADNTNINSCFAVNVDRTSVKKAVEKKVEILPNASGKMIYEQDVECINGKVAIDKFKFTPSRAGRYSFKTSGSLDTYLEVYDSKGNLLYSNDDQLDSEDSICDYNAWIELDLYRGTEYTIVLRSAQLYATRNTKFIAESFC